MLTRRHKQLAQAIDQWVKSVEQSGGSDAQLLEGMHAHMGPFKEILDTTTHADLDTLCGIYPGFYRFANLLERLAQGIQDGVIDVPPRSGT